MHLRLLHVDGSLYQVTDTGENRTRNSFLSRVKNVCGPSSHGIYYHHVGKAMQTTGFDLTQILFQSNLCSVRCSSIVSGRWPRLLSLLVTDGPSFLEPDCPCVMVESVPGSCTPSLLNQIHTPWKACPVKQLSAAVIFKNLLHNYYKLLQASARLGWFEDSSGYVTDARSKTC